MTLHFQVICIALISCSAYADGYQVVRIISPKPDTTVHDNSGNLVVTVAVSPPLQAGYPG